MSRETQRPTRQFHRSGSRIIRLQRPEPRRGQTGPSDRHHRSPV
jgi:hypothetical protein